MEALHLRINLAASHNGLLQLSTSLALVKHWIGNLGPRCSTCCICLGASPLRTNLAGMENGPFLSNIMLAPVKQGIENLFPVGRGRFSEWPPHPITQACGPEGVVGLPSPEGTEAPSAAWCFLVALELFLLSLRGQWVHLMPGPG